MKLLDIISEKEDTNFGHFSEKQLDKLKKLRIAFKSGVIENKVKNVIYTYELSSNYIPYENIYGDFGLLYKLSDVPFGIQIYVIKDDKKTALFDKLTRNDINAIFFGGRWDDTSEHAETYNYVLSRIKSRFRPFDINIWGN